MIDIDPNASRSRSAASGSTLYPAKVEGRNRVVAALILTTPWCFPTVTSVRIQGWMQH